MRGKREFDRSMERRIPGRIIAGCCGLSGFSVAVLAGLSSELPADVVLFRSVVSLVGCYIVGAVVGAIGERAIREKLDEFESGNPVAQSAQTGSVGSAAPPTA